MWLYYNLFLNIVDYNNINDILFKYVIIYTFYIYIF